MTGCKSPITSIELCIETSPPGAKISSGSQYLGKTPKTVRVSGFRSVQVSLDGYRDEMIESDELETPRTYRYIELKKLHQIEFDYKPSGAEVWDGDKLIGKTPFIAEMIAGEKIIKVTLLDHEEYIDRFFVHGETYRTEELQPSIKYISQNLCYIGTNPLGANAESLVVCNETLANEIDQWGVTPIEGTNADIMEKNCDRFFIFRYEDKYPSVLRFRGSIYSEIELTESSISSIPSIPKNGVLDLYYQKQFADERFSTTKNGDMYNVYSVKYSKPVSIVDMQSKASNISGASWLDNRFFVVRTKNDFDDTVYFLFDNDSHRRVRFEDFGFYRERAVPGTMRLGEQIPTSPVRLDSFHDFRYSYHGSGIMFFVRPYSGRECWLVIHSDINIDKPELVDVIIR